MAITEQLREDAVKALLDLGFVDKLSEHPWNEIQMSRSVGGPSLCVWGREHGGLSLTWEQSDDYEDRVNLLVTDDLASLLIAVRLAISLMETIQTIQPVEALAN